jgi:hypothetical protein
MNDGILITEGATLRLSGFSITINKATGDVTADGGKPTIRYDVCPAWLTIAIDHLKDAKSAREAMLLAKDAPDKELKFKPSSVNSEHPCKLSRLRLLQSMHFMRSLRKRSLPIWNLSIRKGVAIADLHKSLKRYDKGFN